MPASRPRARRWPGATAISAIALGLIAMGVATSSAAQSDADETQRFTDDQISAFVAAQSDVQATMADWQARIEAAPSAERDTMAIRQENALVEAVKAHSLSPSTYNAIAEQAQTDPRLTRRIQAHMQPVAPATDKDDSSEQGNDDGTTDR